jgi:hypothetical protein
LKVSTDDLDGGFPMLHAEVVAGNDVGAGGEC